MAYQLFVLKLVKAEAIAFFHIVVIVLYVCNNPFAYLQLDILCRCVLFLILIDCFEVLPYYSAFWYYIGTKEKVIIDISAADIM